MTDFDPTTTSPLYDTFAPAWRANRDFAEMHEHVLRAGTYLDRMGSGEATKEAAGQYNWRRTASFAMDYCADLVDLRVGNLFLDPPKRTYDDSPHKDFIETFLADVDGAGTSMDEFMQRALREQYVNGVDIIVDKTAPEHGMEPRTLADEQALGIRPTLMMRGPLERMDWETDHAGRYSWVRYALGREPRQNEAAGLGPWRYLTLTDSTWTLYTVEDDGDAQTITSGPIVPATLPVVPFYYAQSANPEYPKIPLGVLTRVTPIARAMLNLVSQGQLDLYMAIGILAAAGLSTEGLPSEVGPMCWISMPQDASVTQLAPNVAHIAEKREWLAVMTDAMLRMGKVTTKQGESKANSGIQVAVERTDLDNEMRSTAGQLERVERDVMRLAVSRQIGKDVSADELGYGVEYNRRYVLAGVSDILAQAESFLALNVHEQVPALAKVFTKRVADNVIRPTDPRYQEVVDQIEAATWDVSVPALDAPPATPLDGMQ